MYKPLNTSADSTQAKRREIMSQALRAMAREPAKALEFYKITLDYYTVTEEQCNTLIEAYNGRL